MVRAAIAAFGIPFILSLGALGVLRYWQRQYHHRQDGGAASSEAASDPAASSPAKVAQPAPPQVGKAPARIESAPAVGPKQQELQNLVTEAVVQDWLKAMAKVKSDAVNDANQLAISSAATHFAHVFLNKRASDATLADIRAEVDYAMLDKTLGLLNELGDAAVRSELEAYVRAKAAKVAEVLQMPAVDLGRLSPHKAADHSTEK